MAGRYDFTLKQGSTHTLDITWKDGDGLPIDLTGYTARMAIRRDNVNGSVVSEFTTENDGIAIEPLTGKVKVDINAIESDKADTKKCVYDLEMVFDDYVERILEGTIRVSLSVTR